MAGTEFVVATAIILFVAFCLGWFANWLLHRFTRVAADDVAQLDRMSQELPERDLIHAGPTSAIRHPRPQPLMPPTTHQRR